MHPTAIALKLPRFQARFQANLKKTLTDMGMGRAFGQGPCDFSPMGLAGDYIDEVVHEAVLTVDEQGTTAAAATGTRMMRSAVMRSTPMIVDHPFFCAIRDDTSGAVLFAGVIGDPEEPPAGATAQSPASP
jgi:serpin B